MSEKKQNVFIIGSKGIPSNYGGFETFVEKLTEHRINQNIQYYVACMGTNSREYSHNDAICFEVKVPEIGPAKAVYYDLKALKWCINYIKKNGLRHCQIYILACRIGPFIWWYKKKLHKLYSQLYINPDGHEWMRSKWNAAIRRYWRFSEAKMVKAADLIICDSKNIENYIQKSYKNFNPNTTFIAYGSEIQKSDNKLEISEYSDFCKKWAIQKNEYYLIVGRFVPENNYITILREFMKSTTSKKLVVISNENKKLYQQLVEEIDFEKDKRIQFVGTVYDQKLLSAIRTNAFAYLHGHEVGGTNPSLLEALGATELNLLLKVGFNEEVAEDSALYWNKKAGNLSELMQKAEQLSEEQRKNFGKKAKYRIQEFYNWELIVQKYESIFSPERI